MSRLNDHLSNASTIMLELSTPLSPQRCPAFMLSRWSHINQCAGLAWCLMTFIASIPLVKKGVIYFFLKSTIYSCKLSINRAMSLVVALSHSDDCRSQSLSKSCSVKLNLYTSVCSDSSNSLNFPDVPAIAA